MASTGCYRHVVETNAPGHLADHEANVEEGDLNLFETRTVTEKRSYYIDQIRIPAVAETKPDQRYPPWASAALPTDSLLTTQFHRVSNWARRSSVWPMPFATACCGIELMATACSRFDLARFGAEVMRFSPRQSDLMIVAGRVSVKMLPVLQRIYMQMAEPKWVISMVCADRRRARHLRRRPGRRPVHSRRRRCPRMPARPEMLIEGTAIQIIDNDNLPRDPDGKRLPLEIAVQPNFQPAPQPVDVSIGAS